MRGGGMLLGEYVTDDSTTTVFPVDADGNPTGAAYPIVDNGNLHGFFSGLYLQDEWKILRQAHAELRRALRRVSIRRLTTNASSARAST